MAKAQDLKRGSSGGERIEALQASMNEHGVDLVIVGPTTNMRYLTGYGAMAPAWAPGPMVAYKFAETPKAPGDIYVVNPGDGEGEVLVDGPENQEGLAWSPAEDKLAFAQDGDIHLVSLSGGDLEQLTSGEEIDNSPTWSRDGTLIAFERAAAPGQQTDIYTVDLNGEVLQLTDTNEWESNPTW